MKELYAIPGDEFEVKLDGFVIDIRRGDQLIEIQTTSFAAMGRKLDRLLAEYKMVIVHPIAVETYLHKQHAAPGGETTTAKARRSPKRNDLFGLFDELVSMPTILDHPNLELEVVLVVVDKTQREDPTLRRNRGGWRTVDRSLREVRSRHRFASVDDLATLIPQDLPAVFTTAELAAGVGTSRAKAQKMAYCLRANGLIDPVRRTKRGIEYRLPTP